MVDSKSSGGANESELPLKYADMEVTYIGHCGDDLSVVNAARVSFDKESDWVYKCPECGSESGKCGCLIFTLGKLSERDTKLIRYLARHKHKSPFNHAFITVRVKAPIFVARQLVKHEYMPWNEVSRRYVDSEPEFYFPSQWRTRPTNTKQGSGAVVFDEELDEQLHDDAYAAAKGAVSTYRKMIETEIAPEMARMVLPQNMMTEWYWSGTLFAFAKMLRLRLDGHTQAETREVAEKVRDIIEPLFPVSLNALLEEYGNG